MSRQSYQDAKDAEAGRIAAQREAERASEAARERREREDERREEDRQRRVDREEASAINGAESYCKD